MIFLFGRKSIVLKAWNENSNTKKFYAANISQKITISQKYQQKVESGELNPEDLMKSAQSMLMGMQNIK